MIETLYGRPLKAVALQPNMRLSPQKRFGDLIEEVGGLVLLSKREGNMRKKKSSNSKKTIFPKPTRILEPFSVLISRILATSVPVNQRRASAQSYALLEPVSSIIFSQNSGRSTRSLDSDCI